MKEIQDLIAELVRKMMTAEHEAIETAVEKALQGGKHGVLIVRDGVDTYVGVDSHVPYGRIVEVPRGGLHAWAERGYPF
ncbi:hypothetical protein [Sinomonas sp.]|uniref:hypothetical protein n=1 Tax=Sinomonas sp. TaxID=1914986 RepID=UPI003F7CEC07